VKAKLSLTLDEGLVAFVDAEPGATRSEKIESMLRRYRAVRRDMRLREELAAFGETADDRGETEAWHRVMQEGMWNESVAATSGPSRSRRSRSRARR
jgi:metal-responsive CopG/Arc/MetJ family transcriptional regulator